MPINGKCNFSDSLGIIVIYLFIECIMSQRAVDECCVKWEYGISTAWEFRLRSKRIPIHLYRSIERGKGRGDSGSECSNYMRFISCVIEYKFLLKLMTKTHIFLVSISFYSKYKVIYWIFFNVSKNHLIIFVFH